MRSYCIQNQARPMPGSLIMIWFYPSSNKSRIGRIFIPINSRTEDRYLRSTLKTWQESCLLYLWKNMAVRLMTWQKRESFVYRKSSGSGWLYTGSGSLFQWRSKVWRDDLPSDTARLDWHDRSLFLRWATLKKHQGRKWATDFAYTLSDRGAEGFCKRLWCFDILWAMVLDRLSSVRGTYGNRNPAFHLGIFLRYGS